MHNHISIKWIAHVCKGHHYMQPWYAALVCLQEHIEPDVVPAVHLAFCLLSLGLHMHSSPALSSNRVFALLLSWAAGQVL
jgi:hypothetical protein